MPDPTANLSPLRRADGSASYRCPATGCNILGAVNGPIELPGRRDAQRPEDATIEVLIKPGTVASGVGERYVEGIIKSLLGRIILGREKGFPRRGLAMTLLIAGSQAGGRVERGDTYLPLLPALLHTALLSLLSAGIPLSMTYTSTLLAITPSGKIIRDPSTAILKSASSLHVLAFSSKGHLLLNESQGDFDFETWEKVHDEAYDQCHGARATNRGGHDGQTLEHFFRETIEDKIYKDYAWMIDTA